MKKIVGLIVIVIFIGCNNDAGNRYFTGIVEYAYSYESDSLNADSLARTRPLKGTTRYDTVNYQSTFIGIDTLNYFYNGSFNKCLVTTNHIQGYSCEDYGAFTDSVISSKLYDTDEKILGYSCKILEVQKKNSWLRYYVSNDLKLAPATYNKHVSYNWDYYGEKANGGLILRSEHRFKFFTMKSIATSVSQRDDNFKAFEINDSLYSQICK